MRKTTLPLRALLVSSSLLLGACVIAIDDTGARFHGPGSYHYSSDDGPTVRGSGRVEVREFEISAFDTFLSSGSWDVEIDVVAGAAPFLEIEGEDNILDHIVIEEDQGELRVGMERGSYSYKRQLVVRATTAALDGLSLEGSGDIDARGVDSADFALALAGSGDIRVEGRAQQVDVRLSGSGDIDAQGLVAEDVRVSLAGSGEVHVHAASKLEVNLAGSGDVSYRGTPTKKINIAGSGEVYRD